MAGVKITKRVVDGAEAREQRYTLFDSDVKGFGLRVYPSGQKTYVFEYRPGAGGRTEPKKRVTIGSSTEFTPDEARRRADVLRSGVKLGEDPQGDKAKARAAVTVEALATDFLKEHVQAKRKGNTVASYEHIITTHILPRLGKMKAKDVNSTHVAKLHFDMRGIPSMANKTAAVIGSMYSFAFKRGLVNKRENPAEDVERYEETGVERLLSSAELERLGSAMRLAETSGIPWELNTNKSMKHVRKDNRVTIIDPYAAAALRLLLFTGARLREILHLEWKHVDLERGLLLLPDSKTGKKTIVLNAPAMQVLSGLTKIGRYVIAGESAGTEGEKPRSDLKRPWQSVRRYAGLDDVRLHDLRHNFASLGVGGGLGLPIIGKLLGHKQVSTTQRYAHLDADPVRRAADEIGSRILGAMDDKKKRTSEAAPNLNGDDRSR